VLVLVAALGVAGGYGLRYATARPAAARTPSASPTPAPTAVRRYATDLPSIQVANGWGPVERDHAVGGQAPDDGGPIVLGTTTYQRGFGTNSPSQIRLYPAGGCTSFTAMVGLDATAVQVQAGSVSFQVVADGKVVYDSGVVNWQTPPKPVQVDVTGAQVLDLVVTDGGDGNANDNADWADAALVCAPR
jgi:alpha-galactosidase